VRRGAAGQAAPRGQLSRGHGAGFLQEVVSRTEAACSPQASRSGERGRYEPGAFCWAGLAISDPTAAKTFYTSLFGRRSDELPAGEFGTYAMRRDNGKEVAILYRRTRGARVARAASHGT
jgi:hypothetical protein